MLIMKRNLLGCGLVAGPLFIAASLTQAFTRKRFDLGRHPISLLSLITFIGLRLMSKQPPQLRYSRTQPDPGTN
jgi:hypothetical protein